ncbi:MAG: Si-specific NAD(P)(+) transhydrogenase [Calditrichaeota bacterium]|nr:Si-specific NAD(P)(+) transhydrogenase [Calditrichota bacterium]
MQIPQFDLIVLGSGPGGQRAAISAAKLGKKVAIVERMRELGGVCVATGTIPSKTMREAAIHLSGIQQRAFYGAAYRNKENITAEDLKYRTQLVMAREWEVVRNQLSRNHVEIFVGNGKFKDPHVIVVEHHGEVQEIYGHSIVLAVGTRPYMPKGVEHDGEVIVNADSILELKQLPRTMTCIGGGVIGLEYASIFAALGVQVTVIDQAKELLGFVDTEIVDALIYQLRQLNVVFRLGERVEQVTVDRGGSAPRAVTTLASGKIVVSDIALYSAGRQANADSIDGENAGLQIDNRGRVTVNSKFRTNVDHIFAVGDVIGFPALASTSMEQGRLAALEAFGKRDDRQVPEIYPYGIYTIPEISTVGATEALLTQESIPYEIGVARYREIARGQILGDDTGVVKLIVAQESRRLLGVHAIGTGATELIHIGQAVISLNGTIDFLINAVFNYPTLAECYKTAALDAHNRLAAINAVRASKPTPQPV